jgi:hypothetical protein
MREQFDSFSNGISSFNKAYACAQLRAARIKVHSIREFKRADRRLQRVVSFRLFRLGPLSPTLALFQEAV